MRRAREWICLALFRVVYPLAFLTCSIFRINGFSMLYGVLALISALVRRPTPNSISGHTGQFLLLSTVYCGMTFLAQTIFQIYVAAMQGSDENLKDCSFVESVLRQIGLQKLGNSSDLNATRLILPDVAAFLVSIFVYTTSRALLIRDPPGQGQQDLQHADAPFTRTRLSRLMSQMVIFLGPGVVLTLMALCGISAPSILGSIYFVCFLTVVTLWACGVALGRWFVLAKGALLVFSFVHLLATYLSQMPFLQDLWDDQYYPGGYSQNSTVLLERILGLKRLIYTNCTHPWEMNFYNNHWTDYLNVAVLILFFFVTGIEIRSMGEEMYKSARLTSILVEEESHNAVTDRDSLRAHPSPTRNYNTIDSGDIHPIAGQDWLSRRSSSVESPLKESSRRFESFKGVAVSMGQFVLRQSYMVTLIAMMAWSITYHSWLAFTFLVAACLIWMVPQKRALCLKVSPLIVFYAECLLIISYIYGFKLTDAELPSHAPNGYDLSEVGLSKDPYPFVRLCIQSLFLVVFLFTLKYSQISDADRVEATNLETLDALRRASIEASIQYNEVMNKFGNWVMSFLTKYWILVCSLLFLIMALQNSVVYRIFYMILFLGFITSFQVSYRLWRAWAKAFWVVVISYSMVVLFAIYILQFKDIMEKIHNSTGMSYALMSDIGFEKYGTKDLFVNLLTPTSFLIVIILHLHYFHAKFLLVSDVERYRNSTVPRITSRSEVQPSQPPAKQNWRTGLVRLVDMTRNVVHKTLLLVWRVLEVHIFKAVVMTTFAICALDVCCLNVVLVLAVLILLPLGFNKALSIITMLISSFIIITRMVYQLRLVDEKHFMKNCTFPSNSSVDPNFNPLFEPVNGAHYIGYKKTDSLFSEVRNYIILVLLLAFESIISVHQEQYFNHPNHQRPKPGIIFLGIYRRHADADLISCFKFLANYGFHKFGKEISLMGVVVVMVARMDVFSLIHGFFLGLLVLPRRSVCRAIWPGYLTILIILVFVQYLSCLGLPPILCIEYPWNLPPLEEFFPLNLKVFLFLPDYLQPPYSIKLVVDFFQVLLVYLQMRVFAQENKPEMLENGGPNESIIPEVVAGKLNPTEDFVLFKQSYLDYLKIGIFYYSFWMTLLLLFITGTSRISLFCLGYLVGCFYFLWYGQDLLLKPIKNLNRIWSCMLLYCYGVLMVKSGLQLVGCAYGDKVSCILIQLFNIMCVPVPPYPQSLTPSEPDKPPNCHLQGDRMSLVWDAISFFFIFILLRTYKSWYFQHVVHELQVDNELASRGSELINEMTFKRVDTQKKYEANILNNIRLKVDLIRAEMQRQQVQAGAVIPYTDHYEVIRSGDYYMFGESAAASDLGKTEYKEDECSTGDVGKDMKPPTVGELFNIMSVSGMEAAIEMWSTWQQQYKMKHTASDDQMAIVPMFPKDGESEERDSEGESEGKKDEDGDSKTGSDATTDSKQSASKKIKTFFKFLFVVCWAAVEQLIIFLTSISREYVCISNNLKEAKLKRKRQASTMRAPAEPPLLDLAVEESPKSPLHPTSSLDDPSKDPMLEETRFRKKLPLPLKLIYALFEVFLSHSELLCYFAMILNVLVYGSVLSIVFPIAAFLWATLSCPRPTKAFWLFAIGYTEAIIIIKYIFQFFNYTQELEPKNVFYLPSVFGVTKEDHYAALDIFLLMCLFFHRSVLKQHGLWRDADAQSCSMHNHFNKSDVISAHDRESQDSLEGDPEEGPSSSSTSTASTVKRRKVNELSAATHGPDDVDVVEDDVTDGDGGGGSERRRVDGGEYDDDFQSEMSRICCDNFLTRPIVEYCHQLKDDTFRAATDVYVFIFLADIVTFLIAIFGFSSFGPTDPSISGVMVTAVLKKNKIPSVLLGMLLVQFIFIIIDRAIYLRKQVLFKLVFQIFLVLLVHAWVFFGLPEITQKRFVENLTVQLWYFTKCIYFALSAYQIRCGYPTCILGNFLTKKYNYINLYCFQGFLVIPFLHELRSLMDWMFTDTTLALTSWLQMEDIYSNVFCVKCNRSAEKRYKTPRGNKRAAIVKYGLGGVVLFVLIFIIWLPLLLFSMSNAIFEPNKPVEVSVVIKLAEYQQMFSMSTQDLVQLKKEDFSYFYSYYPMITKTFLSSYQENDCFNITMKGESEGTWTVSPPAAQDMIEALLLAPNVTLQFEITFRRKPSVAMETASAEFERLLDSSHMSIRKPLADLISGKSNKPVGIANIFPRFLVVPASGNVLSADNYFPSKDETMSQQSGNLEFELSTDPNDSSTKWWSVAEYQVNGSKVIPPKGKKSLRLTSFNERVAPSGVLSVLNNYGVFGLYISFVLVISRFVRMYIQGLSFKIMFVELPDPQALLTLCQDIYMVRETREFRLEEELFSQLIFLYRSPETLIKVTKQKLE